jgi:hypothetical protein
MSSVRPAFGHRLSRAIALLAFSGLGLLLGHRVDILLIPEVERAHVLSHTPHGYQSLLAAAFAGAVFGAVLLGVSSILRGSKGRRTARFPSARRIAAVQGVGFLALELIERVWSGAIGHHLNLGVLAAGIAIQILLAFLLVSLVCRLEWFGHSIGSKARRSRPSAYLQPRWSTTRASASGRLAYAEAAPRAPPIR